MSSNNIYTKRSLVINGISVSTASGYTLKGSKTDSVFIKANVLYQERQNIRQARKIALVLMDEYEIPIESKSIVGLLCGGVAKDNIEEVKNWVLRETANCDDESVRHAPEIINELSEKLRNILWEINNGYC